MAKGDTTNIPTTCLVKGDNGEGDVAEKTKKTMTQDNYKGKHRSA